MPNTAALPDDIDALKALVLAGQAQVAALRSQLVTRAVEIEHLKLQIARLRRMQFGRKSEKLDSQIEQLEFRLEELQTEEAAAEPKAPPPKAMRPPASRKPLPAHLQRQTETARRDVFGPHPQGDPGVGHDGAEERWVLPADLGGNGHGGRPYRTRDR